MKGRYAARFIAGGLGEGPCASGAASAPPVGVIRGETIFTSARACVDRRAVTRYVFAVTRPHALRPVASLHLLGLVRPGETVWVTFTVGHLPAGCAAVRLTLASYVAVSTRLADRERQVLYQYQTGDFKPGTHRLALSVAVPALRP